jgi:hypothetical protein
LDRTFFFEHPRVFFMHIGGDGEVEKLAKGVRAILDQTKEIRRRRAEPVETFGDVRLPEHSAITASQIEAILGKGETKNGMLKFVWGRESTMHGAQAGKEMGVNTWAAFFGQMRTLGSTAILQ